MFTNAAYGKDLYSDGNVYIQMTEWHGKRIHETLLEQRESAEIQPKGLVHQTADKTFHNGGFFWRISLTFEAVCDFFGSRTLW